MARQYYASLKAARARGAKPGRPTLMMTTDKINKAKVLAGRKLNPAAIAAQLGVLVASLYRYLPGMLTKAAQAQKRKRYRKG